MTLWPAARFATGQQLTCPCSRRLAGEAGPELTAWTAGTFIGQAVLRLGRRDRQPGERDEPDLGSCFSEGRAWRGPDAVPASRVRGLVKDQEPKAERVLAVNLVVRTVADRPHRGTANHPVRRLPP